MASKPPRAMASSGNGAHLGPAAKDYKFRMEFAGLAGEFVGAGRLVDERRDHQDVDAIEVLVGVHATQTVFEPDVPFVDVGALPLGEGPGEEQHALAGDGNVFEIATRRRRLDHHDPSGTVALELNGNGRVGGGGPVELGIEQFNNAHFSSRTPMPLDRSGCCCGFHPGFGGIIQHWHRRQRSQFVAQ